MKTKSLTIIDKPKKSFNGISDLTIFRGCNYVLLQLCFQLTYRPFKLEQSRSKGVATFHHYRVQTKKFGA